MTDGPATEIPSEPVPHPSPRTLLLLTILAAILTFAVCLNLRLLEAPAWNHASLQVHGEPLMATHDAYYFLAGAQETGRPHPEHEAFFGVTRLFQVVTGLSLNQLGFWAPVFLAPLVVFPLALLAWRERMPEAVLPMGILAGGTLGFFVRTRLGYYDHDMLSLFLPVLLATGLVILLDNWLRPGGPARDSDPGKMLAPGLILTACLALGGVGFGYLSFYASGRPFLTAMLAVAAFVGLVLARSGGERGLVLTGIGAIYLLAVNWWWGVALLGVLALALGPFSAWLRLPRAVWGLAGITLLGVLVGGDLGGLVADVLRQLGKYAGFAPEGAQAGQELIWPSVMQSVREARLLSPFFMAERSGVTWWLFAVGVVGYGYLCWRRPLYLIFLPFLALSLGAIKLGARFTMYGGVLAGLGLGLGLTMLLDRLGLRRRVGAVIVTMVGLVAGLLLWVQVESFQPRPIFSTSYAMALQELRELTPPDARIWTWWDYGYATQYYAQRASFGDGALNSETYLYAMALVHATHSSQQAAQMIKLVTAGQVKQWAASERPLPDPDQIPWPLYLQSPLRDFRNLGPDEVHDIVGALAMERVAWPVKLPDQYFLVAWDNLGLSPWITTFGNWDLREGQGQGGRMQRMAGEISVDVENGTLQWGEQNAVQLDGILHVAPEPLPERTYASQSGWYGVYNDFLGQFLLMDHRLFHSMLVRMLLADPTEFAADFELVLDNYPWVRVYRVR